MVSLKQLAQAGVHFGHKTSRWHPKMKPYIWGSRNKIHLINIAKTAFLLERAQNFLKELAQNGKPILWVGTKKSAQKAIIDQATKLDMPYVSHRWIGGTLSNYDQVKKAVTRLLHLRDVVQKPSHRYTKKEQSVLQKEIERLEKNFGGIIDLKAIPSALVIVDARKERSAIKEALVMGIPVVALVDTNTDPSGINYVIPGNDDSPKSIELILSALAESVAQGAAVAKENQEKERAEKQAARALAKKGSQKAKDDNGAHTSEEEVETTENVSKAKQPVRRPVPRRTGSSSRKSAPSDKKKTSEE